jgi:uncharacterized protein YndB with AHSA1/START domain
VKRTETEHKLELTTPSDREIVMKRVFAAPLASVFDAFTRPELIRRWLLGPDGWSMPVCNVDLNVGGSFRYTWRNDADGREFGIDGVYREIVPNDRIVHVEKMDGFPGEALVTTTFVEDDGLTTVTLLIAYESSEIRDGALGSGMDRGVATSYDRLAAILGQT